MAGKSSCHPVSTPQRPPRYGPEVRMIPLPGCRDLTKAMADRSPGPPACPASPWPAGEDLPDIVADMVWC